MQGRAARVDRQVQPLSRDPTLPQGHFTSQLSKTRARSWNLRTEPNVSKNDKKIALQPKPFFVETRTDPLPFYPEATRAIFLLLCCQDTNGSVDTELDHGDDGDAQLCNRGQA